MNSRMRHRRRTVLYLIVIFVCFIYHLSEARLLCYICNGETLTDCQHKQKMLRCTRHESSCGTQQFIEHNKETGEERNRTKQICISTMLECSEHCDLLPDEFFSHCKISCCERPLCNDVTNHEHTKWLLNYLKGSGNSHANTCRPSLIVYILSFIFLKKL